jgi:outer membrane protein, heavy metal efflux system
MKTFIGFASLMLVSLTAFAQAPAEKIDLNSLLRLVVNASPRLSLERQGIAMAEAERVTAGAHPNPTVSVYQAEQPGRPTNFDGPRSRDISVAMPLLLGGQRGARIKAADRNIDAVRARVGASSNDLAADVGVAYVDLLLAQKRSATLTASLDELDRLRTIIAERHASGLASKYELLRVDVEQVAFRNRAAEAQTEVVERQSQLAILLGFPDWRPVGTDELQPLAVNNQIESLPENPELVAARKEEEASQASIDVARRERFPNVTLNGDRFWTNSPYGYTYTLGVAVEIPIFDTRLGALNKAKAEADAAGLRRALAETKIKADIVNYSTQVSQRTAALQRFQNQAGVRLGDLKQMAEDSYRLGRSSITELLDATRSRYDTEISQFELVAGLMEAQVRLLSAQGLLLK